MAKYKAKSKPNPRRFEELDEWEIDHGAASEAIRNGKPKPVGWYLRDVTKILNLLADRLDPTEGAARRLKFAPESEAQTPDQGEWDSDHATVRACIEAGAAEPVGWYLRGVVETVNRLADTLEGRAGWRADFIRTGGRGRPKGGIDKMRADDRLRMQVLGEGGHKPGQKEAAVEAVKQKTGKSRANIFRAISRKRSS
ncbi:MAG TPA: hypothetical protein VF913_05650 [Xanthobacteraceae bacterium]